MRKRKEFVLAGGDATGLADDGHFSPQPKNVIPAQAGIQVIRRPLDSIVVERWHTWIPAFAGMT
ncbi:hypothetical protein, partial [Massilia aurea]|uniref:hypothetical protein n=1 Tax=Massilia aurea TaxID=373040 RepID=UPI001C83B37C